MSGLRVEPLVTVMVLIGNREEAVSNTDKHLRTNRHIMRRDG